MENFYGFPGYPQVENYGKDENLGHRIRILRNEAGLTLAELGARVDRSASSISDWEKGKSQPSLEDIAVVAGVFGCDPGQLAYGFSAKPLSSDKVEESQAPYLPSSAGGLSDPALAITEKIQARIFEVVSAADGDPSRLGWINEQIAQHLRPPAHWPKVTPHVEPAIPRAEHSEPVRPDQRRAAAG